MTPKKEREGRTVIRTKEERACLAKEAKREVEKAKGTRREKARWAGEKKVEKKGPPLLCTTPPQSKGPHP